MTPEYSGLFLPVCLHMHQLYIYVLASNGFFGMHIAWMGTIYAYLCDGHDGMQCAQTYDMCAFISKLQ